jgi:hypothetical protein
MKTFKKSAIALVLSLGINSAANAKEYTVLLDQSGSSPLLSSQEFKVAAINYLGGAVKQMEDGDVVIVKTFGSIDVASNFQSRRLIIKRHNKKKTAKGLAGLILNLAKSQHTQNSTNLHAWFGRNNLDCKNGAQLIALTDGIEASEYISATNLLNGTKSLPKAHLNASLDGCSIHFYGLGVGRPDKQVTILRNAWSEYFKSANAHFDSTTL